jgi:hypothetical protein
MFENAINLLNIENKYKNTPNFNTKCHILYVESIKSLKMKSQYLFAERSPAKGAERTWTRPAAPSAQIQGQGSTHSLMSSHQDNRGAPRVEPLYLQRYAALSVSTRRGVSTARACRSTE